MKIAVTASGNNEHEPLDTRFGRAAFFMIFDDAELKWMPINNSQNLSAAQGAGIQSAKTVSDAGVNILITGNVGPKAYATLQAAEIRIFLSSAATPAEALDLYKNGKLNEVKAANVDSHWV